MMNIAIIGRSQALYNTALALHEKGHRIAAIITSKALPEYSRDENDFERLAESVGAVFLFTNTLKGEDVVSACHGLDLAVSANWGFIVTSDDIRHFRLGILNAHYADLPRYRGNACVNWALIQGEDRIAVTIHFMEGGKLDCGRIVAREYIDINTETTITDIFRHIDDRLPFLYCGVLQRLEEDPGYAMEYVADDDAGGFRCFPRLPKDGLMDWTAQPRNVHNLVRALSDPFPGAFTYHISNGRLRKLMILETRVIEERSSDLALPGHVLKNNSLSGESYVRCGSGTLAIVRCRYEDEKDIFSPGVRWKSIRMRLGGGMTDLIEMFCGKPVGKIL